MAADGSAVRLPAWQASAVITAELARQTAGAVFRRIRRSPSVVAREYDAGYWTDVLRRHEWTNCANLKEFVLPRTDDWRIATVDGALVRIRNRAYYELRNQNLAKVLREQSGGAHELVELGCGYGANLFALRSLAGEWRTLRGFDISAQAIRAAQEIAAHFRLADTTFAHLDATDPSDPLWPSLSGATVFTYYCLEQLRDSTADVVENLLRARVKRVIHIEPTTELLRKTSPKDWINYLYIKRQGYQDNLISTLQSFQRSARLRILAMDRLYYAPAVRHDPTLVCWEPTGTLIP